MNFFAAHMPSAVSVHITFGEYDEPNVIPAARISYTDGLIQQFRDHGCQEEKGIIAIPARRVCRLHAKGVCKYGKDCKNVHVCCQLGESVMIRRQPATTAPKFNATSAKQQQPQQQQHPVVVRSSPAAPVHTAIVQPMPVFALPPPAPIIVKDALEATAAPVSRSGKLTALDADSLNESSGRLRALVFDVLKCLDESRVENSAPTPATSTKPAEDRFAQFSSTKPSSRVASSNAAENSNSPNTKALQWGAWHPCNNTPKANIISPAAVDANTFLRFF